MLNSIQEYNIPNESNDSSKIESFYKDERENIKSIFVSNSTGEYKFTYKDGRWVVDGNEEIEIQQQKVEEFAYSMTFFDGIFITDDVSDLEQFGLSVPQATISITRINDEVVTFYLGNKTHTSTGYYMKTSLNNRIYEAFIGKGEKFLLPLGSFRIQEFFRLDSSQLRSIAISGKTNGEIFIKAKMKLRIYRYQAGL